MDSRCSFFLITVVSFLAIIFGASAQNNNSFISDCKYFGTSSSDNDNLTFICNAGDDANGNNFFIPDEKSLCQNQEDSVAASGYQKQWIGTINFENCLHPEIPKNFLDIYSKVHNLKMSSLGMTSEQIGFLARPNHLKNLDVSKNHIDSLPDGMLGNSEQLSSLVFSSNNITRFNSDAFPERNFIKFLDMSFNNISELPVTSFHRLTRLEHLLLAHNCITELPSFLFHKMKFLRELNLSSNYINLIDDYAFAGDFQLRKLDLSHNKLTAIPKKAMENLSRLTHLDISFNFFKTIDENMFQRMSLRYISIANNELSEIKSGTFSKLNNLSVLELQENKLKTLNSNILKQPTYELEFLNVGGNQLTEFINFTESTIPNARIAGIDLNEIDCSHYDEIFKSLQWRHFESFSTRIRCNTPNDEATKTN